MRIGIRCERAVEDLMIRYERGKTSLMVDDNGDVERELRQVVGCCVRERQGPFTVNCPVHRATARAHTQHTRRT